METELLRLTLAFRGLSDEDQDEAEIEEAEELKDDDDEDGDDDDVDPINDDKEADDVVEE